MLHLCSADATSVALIDFSPYRLSIWRAGLHTLQMQQLHMQSDVASGMFTDVTTGVSVDIASGMFTDVTTGVSVDIASGVFTDVTTGVSVDVASISRKI